MALSVSVNYYQLITERVVILMTIEHLVVFWCEV